MSDCNRTCPNVRTDGNNNLFQYMGKNRPSKRKRQHTVSDSAAGREAQQRNIDVTTKLREQPCKDCQNEFPFYVMEFDHIPERGPKRDNVMSLAWAPASLMVLLKEIQKCEIVCANCHKIREHRRKEERRSMEEAA